MYLHLLQEFQLLRSHLDLLSGCTLGTAVGLTSMAASCAMVMIATLIHYFYSILLKDILALMSLFFIVRHCK